MINSIEVIPVSEYPEYLTVLGNDSEEILHMKKFGNGYLVCSNLRLLLYYISGIPLGYRISSEEETEKVFSHTQNKLLEMLNT